MGCVMITACTIDDIQLLSSAPTTQVHDSTKKADYQEAALVKIGPRLPSPIKIVECVQEKYVPATGPGCCRMGEMMACGSNIAVAIP